VRERPGRSGPLRAIAVGGRAPGPVPSIRFAREVEIKMSSQETPETPDSGDLQFDHAEYAAPGAATTCVACKNPVSGTYYEVNGRVFCPACRDAVEGYAKGGSGIARFARAALIGSFAACAGFLIYFGVMKLTGWEIGLISILVGFMVGAGVKKGSRHRGGWVYQSLAVFLTYSAIVASYSARDIPVFLAEMREKKAGAPGAAKEAGKTPEAANPGGQAAPVPEPKPEGAARPTALGLVAFMVVVLSLCYALPILDGIQQPIGLLIVGFALWEAWKLNKRVPLVFNGPFEAGQAPAGDDLSPGGLPSHA
jgi:hypothetical protein